MVMVIDIAILVAKVIKGISDGDGYYNGNGRSNSNSI